jgi:hypothetical protein
MSGEPPQRLQPNAVEKQRRRHILEETNAAYARLRADPSAWQEELEERVVWEATLADGLSQE